VFVQGGLHSDNLYCGQDYYDIIKYFPTITHKSLVVFSKKFSNELNQRNWVIMIVI